jgi:cellulose synthase/poly-beta-1,6-N-acetylglucosamine synthase-like glycosyltransferase
MGTCLLTLYLALTFLAVLQAALIVVQTWEHHRFAGSRLSQLHQHHDVGRVAIIVPCKGVDLGLQRNLGTLFRQDYENYAIRFVVESAEDPAYPVIRRLMDRYPAVDSTLLVAGRAQNCGQKVHNLRVATADLPRDIRCLAFVDSDARLRRQWLRALVSRIDQPRVGATTGYRWYVPTRPSFANDLLHSLNSCIAIFLGSHSPTIVWGGSWAIRRELFDGLRVREAWTGMLSDDLVASRLLRKSRLRVLFEPACMVVSPCDTTLPELFWFMRRQYLMARSHMPRWSALVALLSSIANLGLLVNLALVVWALIAGNAWGWFAAGSVAALYGLTVLGGLFRQDLALTYFPRLRRTLRNSRRFEIWMGPITSLANWAGILGSFLGRRLTWRGITYRLSPTGMVLEARRNDPLPAEPSLSPSPAAVETAREPAMAE